ncbi:Uncharacterised protein [Legionella waltersii]|nr:Uncharacterised protein [Legionella waltersii]
MMDKVKCKSLDTNVRYLFVINEIMYHNIKYEDRSYL